jgi:hypothetical protein
VPASPADRSSLLPRRRPSSLRRAAAIAVAIGPGFILRGAGSYVLGERRTGKRLLTLGTLGITGGLMGALAVGATGGTPKLLWPGVPVTLVGAGLYLPTWLADIWVAAGGDAVRGTPRSAPPWSLELASMVLHDPYRTRALAAAAARVELGRVGLGASALLDAGGDTRAGDVEARVRIRGAAATNRPIADGGHLYVRAAARYHRDDPDDVSLATAEVELVGRGELRHLDPLLAGTFLELSTGAGLERAAYAGGARELDAILLGRFAWGAYLGRCGEAMIFYDHRRDHLAGGIYAWRASGFLGSVGARATFPVAGPWAVRAELEIGNAWLGTLALRYHGGIR